MTNLGAVRGTAPADRPSIADGPVALPLPASLGALPGVRTAAVLAVLPIPMPAPFPALPTTRILTPDPATLAASFRPRSMALKTVQPAKSSPCVGLLEEARGDD